MNILICPDKFKDCLKALDVAHAIKNGILHTYPSASITCLPLADGGEGTLEALEIIQRVEKFSLIVNNPLGQPVDAIYLFDPIQQIAYIEMARASGIELLQVKERNPLLTSTFGTGKLILDAIEKGAKEIFLFVGGSATNDGGMGMASALGYEFYDANGILLEGKGKNLPLIARIEQPIQVRDLLSNVAIWVATDVRNPLLGPTGASTVFGPQKGADNEMIRYLDNGLYNLHKRCVEHLQVDQQIKDKEGAGAAGGLGAGAQYFLNAQLISGADFLLDQYQFSTLIQKFDLIITGEGKIDEQTWDGKLISATLAHIKPPQQGMLVCGALFNKEAIPSNYQHLPIFEVRTKAKHTMDSLQNAAHYLSVIGEEIGRSLHS